MDLSRSELASPTSQMSRKQSSESECTREEQIKKVEEEEKKAEHKAPSIMNVTQDIAQNFLGEKPAQQKHIPKKNIGEPVIRPVEFRRIDLSRDLG